MKYWQGYYFVKNIEKHFDETNIYNAVKHDTCTLLLVDKYCQFDKIASHERLLIPNVHHVSLAAQTVLSFGLLWEKGLVK